MKNLTFTDGLEEYLLAGKVTVSFNPTDMNFLERLSRAFSELDALQEEVRATGEKITDDREVFPIARELDGKMRGILNDLFGKEIWIERIKSESRRGGISPRREGGGLVQPHRYELPRTPLPRLLRT